MALPQEQHTFDFSPPPPELLSVSRSLYSDSTPSAVIISLSDVSKQIKDTLTEWLHEDEVNQLSKFSYEKRYREWLAGRICAKQALHIYLLQQNKSHFSPKHNQCKIASEESGRPFFSHLGEIAPPFPELSISHSKEYATAMVSQGYCGIDIQYPAENLLKVKERFMTIDEEHLLQASLAHLPILSRLALAWASKEAVKKMLSPSGMVGFHELILQKVIYRNKTDAEFHFSRVECPQEIFSVAAGLLENGYSLAICSQTELPQSYHHV